MSHPKDYDKKEPEGNKPAVNGQTNGEPMQDDPASPADEASAVARLQAENKELMDTLVRRQADFDNYRKRIERDRQHESGRAVATLIENLLPILDSFDRAIAAHDDPAYDEYRKGFELIRRHLWDVLAKQGLERIEAVGKQFNPHDHHAIERVESSQQEDGTVVEELQAGYRLRDRVLRPAMVRVAVHPAHKAASSESGDK